MDKKLEARIRRLERLMKNEDMFDDDYYEDESDDFDEDTSYATGIKNPSVREMMNLLDGLAKQVKLAGKDNKLVNNQFYKTGVCLRSLDFLIKNADL